MISMDAIRKQQMLAGVPLQPEGREPTHEERKQQMIAGLPVDTAALAERRSASAVAMGQGAYSVPSGFSREGQRLIDDLLHRMNYLMDQKLSGEFVSMDSLTELSDVVDGIQGSAARVKQWLSKQKKDLQRRMKTEKPADL